MILRPYQQEAIDAVYEHLRTRDDNPCAVVPTGCHAQGHPILMYDGTVQPVEQIRVGDEVMGPNSRPRRVLALCRGEDDLYVIRPHRGEPFTVNGDHVLSLIRTNESRDPHRNPFRGDIEDITVREYLTQPRWWRHVRKLYRVPVEFSNPRDLPVPPYILGMLLGDGCLRDSVVELTTADDALADAWEGYATSIGCGTTVRGANRCPTYRMIRECGKFNPLTLSLEALGLADCDSGTKFIPHDYLTASRGDRLQLLAGLIDTDGSRHRSGYEITTKSRELAGDVLFLSRGIGLAATCRNKWSTCQTGAGGWYFRVHIDGDCTEIPCRLERKRPKLRGQKKSVLRTGFTVEPCGRGAYYGFTLDGDHRYVDGHFVVHHNSGKSPIIANICKDAVGQWNGRVLVLAHVKELLEQAADKLRTVCPEIPFGVYSAGLNRRDQHEPVIVAGIQSIWKKACEFDPFDLVIVDECFVAGTRVLTPAGELPIEQIQPGMFVRNATGIGKVEAVSARTARNLVTLEYDDGTTLTCTANHPIFTESGWRAAGSLEFGSLAFGIDGVRMLRQSVSTLDQTAGGWQPAGPKGKAVDEAAVLLDLLREDSQQLHGFAGGSQASERDHESERDRAARPWRERTVHESAAGTAGFAGGGLGGRIQRAGAKTQSREVAEESEDRPCASPFTDRGGVGRPQPPITSAQVPRLPQDAVPGAKRLVRLTHHEPTGGSVVFNLQVSGHPSYFANGLLAHNCHLIPPEGDGMYRQFLADAKAVNPHLRVIGFTATPYRLKSGTICTPDGFLNHVCYEVGIRELIVQGYLCPLISKAGQAKADVSSLHVRGGEFIAGEVEDLMDEDALVEAACAEIVEQTRDRNAVLIFASGVKHGEHIVRVLAEKHGIECGFVTGDTPNEERDKTLARFRNPDWTQQLQIDFGEGAAKPLKYLCNVNVLTTGFDAPHIDCVALVRPTLSPGLYYQMVGRGFRLHESKHDCLVLDFGGNVLRHGPVDQIRVKERDVGTGAAPAKECPECNSLIAAGYTVCPSCGYEFPPPDRNKHDAKASEAGVLSGQVMISAFAVHDTVFSVHTKRGAGDDAPKSLRVDYKIGWNRWKSEWICLEHTGYARGKAVAWWKKRSRLPVPLTAAEAVDIAKTGGLADTEWITVRSVTGEEYDRITEYKLGPIPEAVERPEPQDEELFPFGYNVARTTEEEIPW